MESVLHIPSLWKWKGTPLAPVEASQTPLYKFPSICHMCFRRPIHISSWYCVLSVCHSMQGGRLHQGGTRSEWFHRGQGFHPSIPALSGVWHPAWVSGHWLKVLFNAQVSLTSLVQLGRPCLHEKVSCHWCYRCSKCFLSMAVKFKDPRCLKTFT